MGVQAPRRVRIVGRFRLELAAVKLGLIGATLAGLIGVSAPAAAVTTDPGAGGAKHAQVTLISDVAQAQAGKVAMLGVHFKMEPKWHVYWPGKSDSGGPIELTFDVPEGFATLPAIWPAPKRYVSEGDIVDHIYEDVLTIVVPLRVPDTFKGAATITGTARYVICSDACVFEDAKFEMHLPVAPADKPRVMSDKAKEFQATRSRMARPLPTGSDAPKLTRSGRSVTIDAPGAKGLTFFPGQTCAMLADFAKTGTVEAAKLALTVEESEPEAAPIDGVLEVRYADTRPTAWFVIGAGAVAATEQADPKAGSEDKTK